MCGRSPEGRQALELPSALLRDLATRVVAPLTAVARLKGQPIGRLNPIVDIEGKQDAVLFQELAALPVTALGTACGNLRPRRDELIAALDLLFTGV
ncbi:MAG: CcdB family protein [Candidatus Binatia bacterium]